jgi:hypothetical protein
MPELSNLGTNWALFVKSIRRFISGLEFSLFRYICFINERAANGIVKVSVLLNMCRENYPFCIGIVEITSAHPEEFGISYHLQANSDDFTTPVPPVRK